MAVLASDADDAVLRVDWIVGSAAGAPAGTGLSYVLPPDSRRAAPGVVVTVRATDALGVFVERSSTLAVALAPPALELAGAPRVAGAPSRSRRAARRGRGRLHRSGCGRPARSRGTPCPRRRPYDAYRADVAAPGRPPAGGGLPGAPRRRRRS